MSGADSSQSRTPEQQVAVPDPDRQIERLLAAVRAAERLRDVDVVALTQFSLTRAQPMVAAACGRPVLTTPDNAVRKLQRLLLRKEAA